MSTPSNVNYSETITSFSNALGFSPRIFWEEEDRLVKPEGGQYYRSSLLIPDLAIKIADKMAEVLKVKTTNVICLRDTSDGFRVIIYNLSAFTKALVDYNKNLSDSAERMKNSVVENIAEKANTGPLTAAELAEVESLSVNYYVDDKQSLWIKKEVISNECSTFDIVFLKSITLEPSTGNCDLVVEIWMPDDSALDPLMTIDLTPEKVRALIKVLKRKD